MKNKEDEDVQVGVLLTLLGLEGPRIYETFTWSAAANDVLTLIPSHGKVRLLNATSFSLVINGRSLIATCEYDAQRDSILRDQIVIGFADVKTHEILLFDPQLTLKTAIEIFRACESSSAIADKMTSEAIKRLTLEKFKSSRPSGYSKTGQFGVRRGSAESQTSEQGLECDDQ
ncbi:hypothetical protein OUZ56_026484 [Daphnia magna]|uniref:Uncharacterized protein n=1 Tax=Daphnia magna TaxID=35525 RepID=A0ABQ9ZM14_9CRUS|nr:hypothetical protein OUZ56_026484 [Daphnia magna]